MAERKQTSRVADLLRKSVEAVAEKKANANCFGFMYEPKRPEKKKEEVHVLCKK